MRRVGCHIVIAGEAVREHARLRGVSCESVILDGAVDFGGPVDFPVTWVQGGAPRIRIGVDAPTESLQRTP